MHEKLQFTIILLISSLTLSGAPKRPAWVDAIPQMPHLYQGFGVADATGSAEEDRLRADQAARTEIIQEISSTISSEISSYYEETLTSGDLNSSDNVEMFSSLSSAYAEATIEGIQITDRYFDKKQKIYYSYATLSRDAFQSQMARKAGEARLYAIERFAYAEKALKNGDISSALNHLSSALNHVLVAQSIVKKHLDGDLNHDGQLEFLDTGLSHEIATLLHNIRFIKLGGDGQKGERDQALFTSLSGRLVFDHNGQEIPATNASLKVSLDGATADYTELISTNHDGYFEVRLNKIISASSATPEVSVNFHLPQLALLSGQDSADLAILQSGGVQFNFFMDVTASIKIFVRVLEEINGEPQLRSKSEALLIKALISQKYKVLNALQLTSSISIEDLDFALTYEDYGTLVQSLAPHASYAIVGVISAETSSTGTLNYARSSAKLNVIDLSSGRILATGSQSNIKAAGNTEKKANTSALRKCSYAAITEIMQGLDAALK